MVSRVAGQVEVASGKLLDQRKVVRPDVRDKRSDIVEPRREITLSLEDLGWRQFVAFSGEPS